MATPVARVRACTQSPTVPSRASSTTETYSPAPAGEYHWCPPRPRPAVCWPATTRVPSGVPCAASFAARSLVDEATGKYRTRDPSGVASPCVRACSSPSARPTGTDAARSISVMTGPSARVPARCRPRAPSASARRPTRSRRPSSPVPECASSVTPPDTSVFARPEMMVTACRISGVERLSSRMISAPDVAASAASSTLCASTSTAKAGRGRTGLRDGRTDPSGQPHVVVLDQDQVEQPEAMVGASADTHGVLLEGPQRGRGLTGIEDGDAPGGRVNKGARGGGNA